MNALRKYTDEQLRDELNRREIKSAPKLAGFRADVWQLPDDKMLGFVEIPAGKFLMGSNKAKDAEAYDDECPQRTVDLPRFFMARYPVTVAQFRAYVDDGGTAGESRALQGDPDHPVVWVNNVEALAYAEWLTTKLREWAKTPKDMKSLFGAKRAAWSVALPTEQQWEKAARGSDGRIYPWGNDFDPAKLNCYESSVGKTTSVEKYPAGASPYGILDMVGNVWEWTSSSWKAEYPYRVIRGGSFCSGRGRVRAASRDAAPPSGRDNDIGFRVALSPFSSDL